MATITPTRVRVGPTIAPIFAPVERPPSSGGLNSEMEDGLVLSTGVDVASVGSEPTGRCTSAVVASTMEVPRGKQVTALVAPPSKA